MIKMLFFFLWRFANFHCTDETQQNHDTKLKKERFLLHKAKNPHQKDPQSSTFIAAFTETTHNHKDHEIIACIRSSSKLQLPIHPAYKDKMNQIKRGMLTTKKKMIKRKKMMMCSWSKRLFWYPTSVSCDTIQIPKTYCHSQMDIRKMEAWTNF